MRTGRFVTVCASNCKTCYTNGASKCDPDRCKTQFAFNNKEKTCVGESSHIGHDSVFVEIAHNLCILLFLQPIAMLESRII